MVKKLQALKAAKGFTLVELIVVVTIIGVLAAILVPTMLGMVTKSKVTSANSTASSIKDVVNTFIVNQENLGHSISARAVADSDDDDEKFTWVIKVKNGTVTCEIDDESLAANSKNDEGDSGYDYAAALADEIRDQYTFKNAIANVYIDNGQVIGVVYFAGEAFPEGAPGRAACKAGKYNWDGAKDNQLGLKGGEIFGTYPALTYAEKEA